MLRSAFCVAVFAVLSCDYCHAQTEECSPTDFHVEVTGTAFDALAVSVKNSFTDLLTLDLEATNASIIRLNSTVAACLADIEVAQSACVQCINTTCQDRLDALDCDNVVAATPTGGRCPLGRAVCDLQITAYKVRIATSVATHAAQNFGKKAVATIKNVAQVAINRATSALEAAGEAIRNRAGSAVSGVVNTANNIASDVERIVNNVGGEIVDGLRDAAEEAARGFENAVNEVHDFFDGLGRRRRQAQAEPTCTNFSSDTDACLYYSSQCASCSAFNIGGQEPSAEDLVNGVCGASDLADFQALNRALVHIDEIIEVYRNFTFYASRFNPVKSTPDRKFRCVQTDFGLEVQNISFYSRDPSDPYNPDVTGPQLAQDIFNLAFPNAV